MNASLAVVPAVDELTLVDEQAQEIERLERQAGDMLDTLGRIEQFAADAHQDTDDVVAEAALNFIRALAAKARKGR